MGTIGVLMCFYHAVDPAELRASLDSILSQDRVPDEWAVVADGPVRDELLEVVEQTRARCEEVAPASVFRFVQLPRQVGNAEARDVGLATLETEFVAIQDADDISRPERISRTLRFLDQEGLDFAGSYLGEFTGEHTGDITVRQYPLTVDELSRAVRLNNPIGHPSFVFRRAAAIAVGGYQHLPGNEDYDLVARLVANGYRGANIDEVLVLFRAHPDVFRRRGGKAFVASELELSRRMRSYGLVGPVQRWPIVLMRLGYRLAPAGLKQRAYRKVVARS